MSGAGTLTVANSNITGDVAIAAVGSSLSAGERTTFGRTAVSAAGQQTNEANVQMYIQFAGAGAGTISSTNSVFKNANFDQWGAVG